MPATLTFFILLCLSMGSEPFHKCVPEGTNLKDPVAGAVAIRRAPGGEQKRTVEEALIAVRAKCRKGKLVDGRGRTIRLYQRVGCWGNPPEDYREILARQAAELVTLRKKYTVIEIDCSRGGL